ncbi:hypothetical protein H7I42_31455 [Mycolicibacterium vanbaalenii PYR-1]|nr:hypothetical protein [Mycolicibacterium vanbaalenii PYR-1]QZY44339.1 hypothetical protein K5L12_18840 [Mycolicibacterium austroafricanum]
MAVEPEQHGADRVLTGTVHTATGDDTVGGPLILDLELDQLVGLMGDRRVISSQE